jgi:alkanesulfonate monooxygenase SsuD/methylene tetrahydromethanopterin reductase-like flavin-dependent oxidoreductase (luciferase family)
MTLGVKNWSLSFLRGGGIPAGRLRVYLRAKGGSAMKYGLDVTITGASADAERIAELAARAEAGGGDGFFVQDGVLTAEALPLVDPWVALCAMALRTRRLRIGALMTPLAAYHPWQGARQALSLDQLSHG